MEALRRQLRWVIVIRLVVITSVVLPYLLLWLMPAAPAGEEMQTVPLPPGRTLPGAAEVSPAAEPSRVEPGFLIVLATLTYLASALYLVLLRVFSQRPGIAASIQFAGDLLLVTALIYYFGGISNPFSLLYLIVIAVASTLLPRRAGFAVATAAYCLYAGVVLGIYFDKFPGTDAGSEPSIFLLTYNLAVHLFGFYAVAGLTHLLARRMFRVEAELEEKRGEVAALRVVHEDVVESISSGILTTDLEGRITSVNRAGEEILGRSTAELVGGSIEEAGFLHPAAWREIAARASERPGQQRSEATLERDGRRVYVGYSVSRLTDADRRQSGHIVAFQNLTRFRRLEEELRMKDRMAAVGELASGIAHEIGNPLAAISGSVQMLAKAPGTGPPEEKLLAILLKESQRLDRIIKGFLRFARPGELAVVRFDIAGLLAENFALLSNSEEVSAEHRLELDLEPREVELPGDPDQVSQIFWNLARNGLKAMPDGGTLRVVGRVVRGGSPPPAGETAGTAGAAQPGVPSADGPGAGSGRAYRLSVEDTGRGMSEEERSKLFHPFQSFFDGGTGIGMAIVYRIVQEHGGRIHAVPRPGGGTRVDVELPLDRRVASPRHPESSAETAGTTAAGEAAAPERPGEDRAPDIAAPAAVHRDPGFGTGPDREDTTAADPGLLERRTGLGHGIG